MAATADHGAGLRACGSFASADRDGPDQEVSLTRGDAESDELIQLLVRLDTLGDRLATGIPGEVGHPCHHCLAGRSGVDLPDEAQIELHEIRAQLQDVAQPGIPSARVVNRQPTPSRRRSRAAGNVR